MGHLQPLLPYANALVARGHEVLVAGPEELRAPLLRAGLLHAPFDHPGDEGLAPIWARLRAVSQDEQPVIFVQDIFAGANARAAIPGLLATIATWQPQLIIRDSVEFGSIVAAEVASVPHVRVAVHQRQMEEHIRALAAAPIDTLRQAAGLSGDGGASLQAEPIFTAFPESFEGPATDAALGAVYRVGPGKEAQPSGNSAWQPNRDGLPLIYVTFGTVLNATPEALPIYRTAIAAIAELPVRALLTTGRGFDIGVLNAIPENLRVEAWVPQADVLQYAGVLVCHGGSGTVLGGLAAGIPQVVVPFGADQPENAKRIAAIGAGLALVNPEADALGAAIQRVLANDAFRQAARAVAIEMAKLPTVDDAVDALLEHAAG